MNWTPVLEYEDLYEVSDAGNIRRKLHTIVTRSGITRVMKEKTLATVHDSHGYNYVYLCRGGKRTKAYLHRLVWEAFKGQSPSELQIRHLNGVRSDNRLSNLAVGDRIDNAHDVYDYGGRFKKLFREDVLEIRRMLAAGYTQKEIAETYDISRSSVSAIKVGRTFGYL